MTSDDDALSGVLALDDREVAVIEQGNDGRAQVVIRDRSGAQIDVQWWRQGTGPWRARVSAGTVVAGRLLDGAVAVEVRAPQPTTSILVLRGMYVALVPGALDREPIHVLQRDTVGRIVPQGLTGVLHREPVSDAEIPCPVCGGLAWEAVEIRAGRSLPTTRMRCLRCEICGHQHGGWRGAGRRRRSSATDHEPRRGRAPMNDEPPSGILRRAGFEVYEVDHDLTRSRSLRSWGGEDDQIGQVTIAHDLEMGSGTEEVEVSTSKSTDDDRSDDQAAVDGLEGALHMHFLVSLPWGEVSREAIDLMMSDCGRDARRRAEQSAQSVTTIRVDGRPTSFVVRRDREGFWSASARCDSSRISIRARFTDPGDLELRALSREAIRDLDQASRGQN